MSNIIIVTRPDLGWDCVVDVFLGSEYTLEQVKKEFPSSDGYIVDDKTTSKLYDNPDKD